VKKLNAYGLKWLKGFHLIAVCCWLGGGVSVVLLYFLKGDVNDGSVLFGINQSIHFVDISVIIIPGGLGCFITGLAFGFFSRFGFFRHGWIILKWISFIVTAIIGTFFLGPWERGMVNISGEMGLAALHDANYLYNQKMYLIIGALQCMLVLVTIFISIFKPWKNISKTAKNK